MRALILLGLIGYVLGRPTTMAVDLTRPCPGCHTPLEGANTTIIPTTKGPEQEITKEPLVKWPGTWIPIENTLGFGPRVKEDEKSRKRRAPSKAMAQDTKQEEEDEMGIWNNLSNSFGFPTEQPHVDQVTPSVATPMKGCNKTINSTTTNSSLWEKDPEPAKAPQTDAKLHVKTAVPASTKEMQEEEDDEMGIWHSLSNSFGFPTEQPHVDQEK